MVLKKKCISLRFVFGGRTDNMRTLNWMMAWCRTGDKPLPEPMVIQMSDVIVTAKLSRSSSVLNGRIFLADLMDFCYSIHWFVIWRSCTVYLSKHDYVMFACCNPSILSNLDRTENEFRSIACLCLWLYSSLFVDGRPSVDPILAFPQLMMTSSNGIIFRVAGHLWGESSGHRWVPLTNAVTRSFDIFFDLRLNKWLSKV